jgi:hypothetical protein
MASTIVALLAVTSMHEHMDERTGQQQQIRKNAEQMRAMFRKKEEPNNREERD